jgi:TolA-binding protein
LNNSRSLNFEAEDASSIFNIMKRALVGIVLGSLLATAPSRAADAVSLAAQQETEERYKNLVARIEETQAAQSALEKRISTLQSDFSKLRDEIARNNNSAATQEALHGLRKDIGKVDQSRLDDNKRIEEALQKLGSAIKSLPTAPPPRRVEAPVAPSPAAQAANNTGPAIQNGFEYVVQKGDNHLGVIVKKCNDDKIPVTSKMIMNANPTVDWTRLRIGDKIFIPKPK